MVSAFSREGEDSLTILMSLFTSENTEKVTENVLICGREDIPTGSTKYPVLNDLSPRTKGVAPESTPLWIMA
jgi:hypothetical protein